jgi:hypothetical protein
MWFILLSFLPDWFVSYFVHIIFGAGVIGIIAGTFLSKIPLSTQDEMILTRVDFASSFKFNFSAFGRSSFFLLFALW